MNNTKVALENIIDLDVRSNRIRRKGEEALLQLKEMTVASLRETVVIFERLDPSYDGILNFGLSSISAGNDRLIHFIREMIKSNENSENTNQSNRDDHFFGNLINDKINITEEEYKLLSEKTLSILSEKITICIDQERKIISNITNNIDEMIKNDYNKFLTDCLRSYSRSIILISFLIDDSTLDCISMTHGEIKLNKFNNEDKIISDFSRRAITHDLFYALKQYQSEIHGIAFIIRYLIGGNEFTLYNQSIKSQMQNLNNIN